MAAESPLTLRERQQWARARGHPQWLWPEVSRTAWAEAMAALAEAAGAVLSGDPVPLLTGDPLAIGLAGYISGMGPMCGGWIESGRLRAEPTVAAVLTQHLAENRARQAMLHTEAATLIAALRKRGIVAALLKGAHTAQWAFPDPAWRVMSDIDVLIAEADGAATVLRELGYQCTGRSPREQGWARPHATREPKDLFMVHAEDPWAIDLHVSLAVPLGDAALVALDRAEPLRSLWRGGLEPDLLLLHLAAHAGSGLHNLTLQRLAEIVRVVRRAPDGIDWRRVLHLAALCDGTGAIWPALALTERLVPGTIPEPVLAQVRARAPARVRILVDRLTPATAQRVERNSLREHFMWASGGVGWARQLAADLIPSRAAMQVYLARASMLLRGEVRI